MQLLKGLEQFDQFPSFLEVDKHGLFLTRGIHLNSLEIAYLTRDIAGIPTRIGHHGSDEDPSRPQERMGLLHKVSDALVVQIIKDLVREKHSELACSNQAAQIGPGRRRYKKVVCIFGHQLLARFYSGGACITAERDEAVIGEVFHVSATATAKIEDLARVEAEFPLQDVPVNPDDVRLGIDQPVAMLIFLLVLLGAKGLFVHKGHGSLSSRFCQVAPAQLHLTLALSQKRA